MNHDLQIGNTKMLMAGQANGRVVRFSFDLYSLGGGTNKTAFTVIIKTEILAGFNSKRGEMPAQRAGVKWSRIFNYNRIAKIKDIIY